MTSEPTDVFVIAEAGVNHNGSLDLALKLVDVAADAGADAVKFQTFNADELVSASSPKADYQTRNTAANESQLEMLRALELSHEANREILKHCRRRKIEYMSTPFDLGSLEFLVNEMNVSVVKVPSGEITNGPFLIELGRCGKPLIISTGASDLDDIRLALCCLNWGRHHANRAPGSMKELLHHGSATQFDRLKHDVTILHCVTAYPAPIESANLRAMDQIKTEFGLPFGFSDHTLGISASVAAVALGASVIEKHFTLDKGMSGPDHEASLEPGELKAMIGTIREVTAALGDGKKRPMDSEIGNRQIARQSLVAATDIAAGTVITAEMLMTRRPGAGISPMEYFDIVGKPALKSFSQGDVLLA